MLKERDIPNQWRNKLSEIQETFPNAAIAGGCLRDLYHGVEIKDIDVFIPNADNPKIHSLLEEYKKDHSHTITRSIRAKTDYKEWVASTEVETVFTMKIGSLSIDVIGVTSNPDQIIERFDFGICQIQYDGYDVRYSPEFKMDCWNKTFTLIRCDKEDDWVRSMKRFEKFKQKYPKHTLDISRFEKQYGLIHHA